MKTCTIAWLYFCLIAVGSCVHAADAVRERIENDIQQFRLIEAEAALPSLSDAPLRAFYRAHIAGYKYVCTQSGAQLKVFHTDCDAALASIGKMSNQDEMKRVLVAELEGKRAAIEFADANFVAALWHLRACHSAIAENERYFPNCVENKKIIGMFNVVFSAVPRKYQWITSGLGFEGDMKKGLAQLAIALGQGTLLRYETQFIAYHVDKNLLAKPEDAILRIQQEQLRSGKSIVLDFLLAGSYLGQKKNENALAILSRRGDYVANGNIFFINYWDYLQGKAYYYCGRYDAAQQSFTRFLNAHGGNIYRTDASFRLGMCYVLTDNYPEGRAQFKKLLLSKPSIWDEDEYASHMAAQFVLRNPTEYEKTLFSARNLFDGGYCDEAKSILLDVSKDHSRLSALERTEFHYRLGRVYDLLKDRPNAIVHYTYCTQQPPASDGKVQRYLQAYSHYYLGDLYRAGKDNAEAKIQYQKALAVEDFFYQSSLESRCKTSLKQLK